MKINDTTQSLAALKELLNTSPGRDGASAPQSAARTPEDAFSVNLSPNAMQAHESAGDEEISRDRVAAIREQLAKGTYTISGKDVANKILGALKG